MSIREFVRKPYPMILNRWGIILSISLFVSLFMMFFQPFGLQQFESEYRTLLLAGYGLVTFLVLFVDMIVLPRIIPGIFKEEKWTVFREFFFLIWIVLTIALGNYTYSFLLSIVSWHGIKGFLIFLLFTSSIGLFPIIGLIIMQHNRRLKIYLEASQEMNQLIQSNPDMSSVRDNLLTISSDNNTPMIETMPSNLICLESEGNYVNTWYLEEGKIIRLLIRNTLKNIELQIEKTGNLFRCHRAYVINLSYIEKVTGNSQGYRVIMKYLDKDIPVARNYSKEFREAMSNRT